MKGIWTMSLLAVTAAVAAPRDYPIQPVPFTNVKVDDAFWTPRFETNRTVTVKYDFRKCEETGRISNFEVAGGLKKGGFQGIFFNDSDVVKVIEGAAYTLAIHPDPELDKYLDDLIAKIAAAQEDDGYLYTARTINDPKYKFPGKEERWSHLRSGHELYNVGHMYEAAVEHFRATGKRAFLDVAIKNADLVCKVFGEGKGQRIDVPGHEEIEIGLAKLYRVTGDPKYLKQAKFFIDMRGRSDKRKVYGEYCQDHVPVVEQDEAVGHAVRAGYLYAGVADVAALTGDKDYLKAIDRIWNNIVSKKMHLTGGIGASRHGEAFGKNYELPNKSAYLETCAAIANALFNHRMFLLHGDGKYIDVLERIIYNGFLSGISLSGDRFFYPNPLASDGKYPFNQGSTVRNPWFGCSCCPVNVVRFIPSIAGYVYAVREDSVYVNLYLGGSGRVPLDGGEVKLTQETRYPWDGNVKITVDPGKARAFELCVRIPGWFEGRPVPGDLYRYVALSRPDYRILVNGKALEVAASKGYARIKRKWAPGDVVQVDFPMLINRVISHENVAANKGRVAIERGPVVYCVEGADHDGRVMDLFLPDDAGMKAEHRPDLLGGVTVIKATARSARRNAEGKVEAQSAGMTLIPNYAWCHRGANEMAVWLPRELAGATVAPMPTLASESRATASHSWQADHIEALGDQQEPKNSNDHEIPRFTWWDHRGSKEWVQYEFKKPASVSSVSVYWFDDTGRGQCRVPASWRLLYRDGGEWKPVEDASAYGVARDTYNKTAFKGVTTDALRVEVQLQDTFSGGILEWSVR